MGFENAFFHNYGSKGHYESERIERKYFSTTTTATATTLTPTVEMSEDKTKRAENKSDGTTMRP